MSFDLGNLQMSLLAPRAFETASDDSADLAVYASRLADIQRFRGRTYVDDQAIPADALDADGRHLSEVDADCWHLTLADHRDQLQGCMRIRRYDWFETPASAPQLMTHKLIDRMAPEARAPYQAALEAFIRHASAEQADIIEAGGWAVAPDLRRSAAGLSLALAVWSLSRMLGRTMGISPTTVKHHTVRIHHRLGGFPLEHGGQPLPAFYDDYHRCEMELVAFDSDRLSPRYERTVADIGEHLLEIAGACCHSSGIISTACAPTI